MLNVPSDTIRDASHSGTGDDASRASLPSVLMDLRPCYEGFAGIPQEVRILFGMFTEFRLRRFGGFASGIHFATRHSRARTPFEQVVAQTRALISQDAPRHHVSMAFRLLPRSLQGRLWRYYLTLSEAGRSEKLDLKLDPAIFADYLWMKLFDKTLMPSERDILGRAEFLMAELGHEHARSMSLLPRFAHRRVHTDDWDVFFAANVSPYRLSPNTAMMIRYYDALPLLSPHTVGEPWPHAQGHARMLKLNMDEGASFFCDSEPVRGDLLKMFPQAERRVHTIPAALASGYVPETCPPAHVRAIFRRRAATKSDKSDADTRGSRASGFDRTEGADTAELKPYFLAVSTLEPRKNYLKLFHAFEMARRMTAQKIQLVVVANKGWRADAEAEELKALVREGAVHLAHVPLAEMRLLYSMAHCVVAPSRAEGFDYSGVEAMACGAPVLASDIPVHRWVYGEAPEYVDAYDEVGLARAIARIADLPREEGHLAEMSERGLRQVKAYRREALAPRWEQAVQDVVDVARARAGG